MAATRAEEASVTPHQLNDDVVTEILLRLPSTSVLRFRSVSRAWRAITTRPDFLAAHARRRPPELIISEGLAGALHTLPLDDLDDARIRCLLPSRPGGLLIASCDGLLLFEVRDAVINSVERLLVCNPVTRQWTAVLPPRSDTLQMTRCCGFYLHRPSGEHRILFLTNDDNRGGMGTSASHYVRSLETGETRLLGPAAATVYMYDLTPRVLHHRGNLHWVEHPEAVKAEEILVFDTVQETFGRMNRAPVGSSYDVTDLILLETAEGMLAVAAILMLRGSVDLWVMEDYNNGRSWTRRHRVDLPLPLQDVRWVMAVGQNALLLPGCLRAVLYDPAEKRVLKQMVLRSADHCTGPVFRESLQRHAFFDLQQEQF